jgi:hypothetical protein
MTVTRRSHPTTATCAISYTPVRYRQGAMVRIKTRDGRVSTGTVHVPKGAAMLGTDRRDVDAKYSTPVSAPDLPDEAVEVSLAVIHDFRRVRDVASLTGLVRMG